MKTDTGKKIGTEVRFSTLLNCDFESAGELIKDIGAFSQLIAGVEKIQVSHLSNRRRVSEWTINMNGLRVNWKEEELLDLPCGRVGFQMIEGPFDRYEGHWKIAEVSDSQTRLSFFVKINWGRLLDLRESERELDRRAKLAIRWMLRKLRERSGVGVVIEQECVDSSVIQSVVSEFVSYQNRAGRKMIGVYDHLRETSSHQPFVVIPPGYGETKRDSLTLAHYLARNGFRVLRYDATDHLGESEGDIFDTTLPKMKDDLLSTLDFVQTEFRIDRCAVVASSLAKRVAIRAAVEDARICFLLGLVGVVDIQATLKAVYYKDIIGAFVKGEGWDTADILGFEVSRQFPETAIRERYHDLSGTIEEVQKLKIPLVFLVAEKDAWVKLEDVKLVFEAAGREDWEMHIIPDTMHRIYENPKSARSALRQAIVSSVKYLRGERLDPGEVKDPNVRDIAIQNRIEKDRLRSLRPITKEEERRFWGKYMGDYVLITKCPDFRSLLSLADLMLGMPHGGERILDAGCGIGHYGVWLLWSAAAKFREAHESGIGMQVIQRQYFGLDFVPSALREAARRLERIKREMQSRSDRSAEISFSFVLSDLDQRLPFPDDFFDKVCCNLVISYVANPRFTMHELIRVLRPGGRIVVSSLKPYADLSQIYRNFVVQSSDESEIEEARRLLSNAGKVRQKEEEGQYRFFSESKLRALISAAGGREIKSFQTFGEQAYLVVGSKTHE